jgi:hypothetical protein
MEPDTGLTRADIEPEQAIEAVFDPRRLVARDSKLREAIRGSRLFDGHGPDFGRVPGA